MNESFKELLDAAEKAVPDCYCPYSGFHVTAILEDESGGFHTGVNIENSSYGLTICAERAAIFSAVSNGHDKFRRILIYSPDGEPFPCGACREVLAEFCSEDFQVTVASPGTLRHFSLIELLPHRFKIGFTTQK